MLTHPNISLPIIGIYLTHKCNLQCRHCFWATDKTFSRELTFEEWKYVLGKFIKIGTRHFHICGREPTLSEKLLNILAFLKNMKVTCYPELKYGIITNGASLDENYAFALANLGLDYIEISLDGTNASNDHLRGKGEYEKVINSIELLLEKGLRPSIASVIYNTNIDDLIAMCKSLYIKGIRKFFFQILRPFNRDNFNLLITPELLSTFINQMYMTCKEHKNISLQDEIPSSFIPFLYKDNRIVREMFIKDAFLIKMDLNSIFRIRRHPYSCQAFWHRGRITADGYLLGCDMFIAYPNYLEFSAGNVREKDPSALISSFLKEGGKELIADLFQKPSECIKCPYLKLCGGGCRAYSKLITGEWNTPECEIFRKIF